MFSICRAWVRDRNLRFGLAVHLHLGSSFDGEPIFRREGKAAMADAYRRWRWQAVALTRWQSFTVSQRNSDPQLADPGEESLQLASGEGLLAAE